MRLRQLFLALVVLFPLQSFAGSFKVFPLNLQFDQGSKTASLKISNTSESAVTVQLDGVLWAQNEAGGEDVYQQTKDILVFPKILKIERGEERVVRIGFNGVAPNRGEKAYRLFIEELPSASSTGAMLSFFLRLSIPVFVLGPEPSVQPTIEKIALSQAMLRVFVRNKGNEHAMVNTIDVTGLGAAKDEIFRAKERGWYVLPGAVKEFRVKLDKVPCDKAKTISLQVESGATILTDSVAIKPQDCVAPRIVDGANKK